MTERTHVSNRWSIPDAWPSDGYHLAIIDLSTCTDYCSKKFIRRKYKQVTFSSACRSRF